jgi:glycosyltransferase involved in cell wall biosynthesis
VLQTRTVACTHSTIRRSEADWMTELAPGSVPARVSVVIPALNEAENLPHVLPLIPPWVHEVILVDGESTDGTAEVARRLWPDISILAQQGKGKGAALRTGFQAATGDIVVMLDADGSTDPREMPAFIGLLLSGADFVKGSRYIQGGGTEDISLVRAMGNSSLLLLVRVLFGYQYSDLCYGYNAFWKRVLPVLALDVDGFEIETSMNLRALKGGLRVAEVPSFESKRIYGNSRLSAIRDGWRVLKTILKERFAREQRLMGILPVSAERFEEEALAGLGFITETPALEKV